MCDNRSLTYIIIFEMFSLLTGNNIWGHIARVSLFNFLKIPLCFCGFFVISFKCHNFIYSLFFCWFSFFNVLFALGLWQEIQAKVCGDMNLGISQAMAYGNN
jgi:hypothetical protein